MTVQLANSPDSWGVWFPADPRQVSWRRYLDEVAQAGYKGTELGPYGYLPTDPLQLKAELDSRGLQMLGGFVMRPLEDRALYPTIERETLQIGELLASVGASFIVLIDGEYRDLATGRTTAAATLDDDQWKCLTEAANQLGRAVQSRLGLRVAFHPHADTHVEYASQAEQFVADTDSSAVSICLDIGHFEYCGGDALEFFKKHHDRIPYLHLKSVSAQIRTRVIAESLPLTDAVKLGVFCEPEQGTFDYASFARVLDEVHFNGWSTVEQDRDPTTVEDALPSAERTLQFLERTGLLGGATPASAERRS